MLLCIDSTLEPKHNFYSNSSGRVVFGHGFPGWERLKEAEAVIGKAVWRVRCCRIVRASLHGNTALCLSLLNTSGIAQLLSPPRRAACWPVSDQTSALFCSDFLPVLCLSQESIGRFSQSFFPVDGPRGVYRRALIHLVIES